MQTFVLLVHGDGNELPGESFRDRTIQDSKLLAEIKKKAAEFPDETGKFGSLKVVQHRNNPDAFSFVYFSPVDHSNYKSGGSYTSAQSGILERQQFEQYPDESSSARQIDAFLTELRAGNLVPFPIAT